MKSDEDETRPPTKNKKIKNKTSRAVARQTESNITQMCNKMERKARRSARDGQRPYRSRAEGEEEYIRRTSSWGFEGRGRGHGRNTDEDQSGKERQEIG